MWSNERGLSNKRTPDWPGTVVPSYRHSLFFIYFIFLSAVDSTTKVKKTTAISPSSFFSLCTVFVFSCFLARASDDIQDWTDAKKQIVDDNDDDDGVRPFVALLTHSGHAHSKKKKTKPTNVTVHWISIDDVRYKQGRKSSTFEEKKKEKKKLLYLFSLFLSQWRRAIWWWWYWKSDPISKNSWDFPTSSSFYARSIAAYSEFLLFCFKRKKCKMMIIFYHYHWLE